MRPQSLSRALSARTAARVSAAACRRSVQGPSRRVHTATEHRGGAAWRIAFALQRCNAATAAGIEEVFGVHIGDEHRRAVEKHKFPRTKPQRPHTPPLRRDCRVHCYCYCWVL